MIPADRDLELYDWRKMVIVWTGLRKMAILCYRVISNEKYYFEKSPLHCTGWWKVAVLWHRLIRNAFYDTDCLKAVILWYWQMKTAILLNCLMEKYFFRQLPFSNTGQWKMANWHQSRLMGNFHFVILADACWLKMAILMGESTIFFTRGRAQWGVYYRCAR